MSTNACACCDELERELELCHEALNRGGMDLRLVATLTALEEMTLAFDLCSCATCEERLLQAARDHAQTKRAIDDEGNEGATEGAQEGT